jgi:hypothetical protein
MDLTSHRILMSCHVVFDETTSLFDISVSHKGGVFFQWEATFPSTAPVVTSSVSRSDPRLSLPEVLIGVECVCVRSYG